ncbi:MAG: hypothetical protein KC423_15135 [Anaerolineales bacterium]|nr:hypothetical protein [Anaerolineales bacterium]
MNKQFWDGKPWQAFKTFAILFSFTMNLILLIVLLLLAPHILPLVDNSVKPLVGGLNNSFVQMSSATISRTIVVDDTMPIAFTLPLETTTDVTVVRAVPLEGVPAQFRLPDGGGVINGQVFLELPKDLTLPVHLALDVPVDQEIPVHLAVGVQIPLNETELGEPFMTLQGLFEPLDKLLQRLPGSNAELIQRIRGGDTAAELNETAVSTTSP